MSVATGTINASFYTNVNLQWWNGPDEDLGYIIAYVDPSGDRPNAPERTFLTNYVCNIGFFRSAAKTDQSFVDLAKLVTGSYSLSSATQSKEWLNNNGYWTSWTQSYTAGLFKTTYSGYFNDVPSFFATATPQAFGSNPATSIQTTSISEAGTDDGSNFSCQWLGYFKPTTTQTYTFYTNSDDASYVWIGANAISGFTTANAIVNNGGAHGPTETSGSIALTAGVYYPIRIQFGEASGGDVMTFNFSTSTITKTTNVTGLVFYNSTTNNF
jgi:hypothetical protein